MNINEFMDRPTPGQGMASGKKGLHETPPDITDKGAAIGRMWDMLSGEFLPELLRSLRSGVPISQMAKLILDYGFVKGTWTVDMILLLMEPTILMMMWLAQKAGVDYILDPAYPKPLTRKINDDTKFNAIKEQGGQPSMKEVGLMVEEKG